MNITKTEITINDLIQGYVNDTDTDIENGVYAYGGKLCVRPEFQRSFVYDDVKANAVIDTVLKGYPLNTMYWIDNGDGTYNCLDGQQRTISICNFADNLTSFQAKWMPSPEAHYYRRNLQRIGYDERFLNYKLDVYICKGTKDEQMEWFKTINIAGEKLTDQELRNINYPGKWLTDAKRYFSKANASSTKKCPAEAKGHAYTKKNANRQELLEQVITWIVNSDKDEDICNYMAEHQFDENASELITYYENVIDWVNSIFINEYTATKKAMAGINWGALYNEYHDNEYDPDEIDQTLNELIQKRDEKILDVTIATIIKYCITGKEETLTPRAFSDTQKNTLYNRQHGKCAICGNSYALKDMQAHHIVPWINGGQTELDNGQMVCKKCHKEIHL